MTFIEVRRAENGTRTRDPQLGKLMLYQLSYFRMGICFRMRVQRYKSSALFRRISEKKFQKGEKLLVNLIQQGRQTVSGP